MGHSFIYWAQRRAAAQIYSVNLGLDPLYFKVSWLGIKGLNWEDFVSQVVYARNCLRDPHSIIAHAGGNDVQKVKLLDLIGAMREDLAYVSSLGPGYGSLS